MDIPTERARRGAATTQAETREIRLVEVSLGGGVDDATVKATCKLGGAQPTASQDALADDETATASLTCAWQPGAGAWVAAPGRPELTLLPRAPSSMDWAREAQGVFPDDDQKARVPGGFAPRRTPRPYDLDSPSMHRGAAAFDVERPSMSCGGGLRRG